MAVTNYISMDGMLIGEMTAGVMRNYGTDALGSVVETVLNGVEENTYQYKPYGGLLAKTGVAADPSFLWNGVRGVKCAYFLKDAEMWDDLSTYSPTNCRRLASAPSYVIGAELSSWSPSNPTSGIGGATMGVQGWISCYDDDTSCGQCETGGATPISSTHCPAPYCCIRSVWQEGSSQNIGAVKVDHPAFRCFDIVQISSLAWNKISKTWIPTGKSVVVTIVDTGRLTRTDGKDDPPARDGLTYERVVDIRGDNVRRLFGTSCDADLGMARATRIGHGFPDERICWRNRCHKDRKNRPPSECAEKRGPVQCKPIDSDD